MSRSAQTPTPETLKVVALEIRQTIIDVLQETASGHTAGAMGMVELLTTLYWSEIRHDPHNPLWQERDYVLLSNGHTCPGLYTTLAVAGYFPKEELYTLREINSRLQGHPHKGSLPGIETSSGPLGQGLSIGAGLATAMVMNQKHNRIYVIMGDGEQQEGQNWEAYWYAGARGLHNLTVCIDRNHIQIDGPTETVLGLEPFAQKLEAFGWQVQSVDGHDFGELQAAFKVARAEVKKPSAILCNTIPGKGAAFMENDYTWHGKPPSPADAIAAVRELRADPANEEAA